MFSSSCCHNFYFSIEIISITTIQEDAGVFVPSCDVYGKFEFRGCVHPRQPEGTPTCYCATADGQIVGDKVSLMQLPEGCDGGKPHGNGTTGEFSQLHVSNEYGEFASMKVLHKGLCKKQGINKNSSVLYEKL